MKQSITIMIISVTYITVFSFYCNANETRKHFFYKKATLFVCNSNKIFLK